MSQEAVAEEIVLSVAQIVACTEAEGPGRRFALWFQGCPLRCPGCCNPEMLPFAGGQKRSLREVVALVEQAACADGIEGITLLGGEPLAHAREAAALAQAVRDRGLSVMVFSGYTLEEARRLPGAGVAELLGLIDILVDGPYIREQPETRRRWIGSANQQIHFLTDRYRADDPRWLLPNTLEVRLEGLELTVNGFPARSAVGLWRRPRRQATEVVREEQRPLGE
jgi:anaerobic ribonucleoside-triphosphate reductase activating protein